jgi:protoheme IX farnesyltransferase
MNTVAVPFTTGRSALTGRARDYAELVKMRVTSLIVMTAACGFVLAARHAGIGWLGMRMFHALAGIAAASGGTAALNEVMERHVDARMRRTMGRPLPGERMSVAHAAIAGGALGLGGCVYLGVFTNLLTAGLTLLTMLVYLGAYTPLKQVSPVCTFIGAFPGAMPGVLGWTAVRGRLDWGALVLFAILFLWQFPHFFSIAWLYREDYARAGVRMLPVVARDGRSTSIRILLYSTLLLPVSLLPGAMGMAGGVYMACAALLGIALLYCGVRLARVPVPFASAQSSLRARQLLQATVFYLPLLFIVLVGDSRIG